MAIITFSTEENSSYEELPWIDVYVGNLKGQKLEKFLSAYHVVMSGVEASSKGWIVNSREFKAWVWKSDFAVLQKALDESKRLECALLMKFVSTKNGKLKPIFAIDDEIPALLSKLTESGFSYIPF